LLALAAVACPRHLPVLLAPGRNDDRRGLEANLLPVFVLLGAVFVGALIVGLRSWARLCPLRSRAITLIAATAGFLGWLGHGAQRSLLARVAVVATLIAPFRVNARRPRLPTLRAGTYGRASFRPVPPSQRE